MLTLFTLTFTMDSKQYRPANAYQEVSNTNNFGSVSDSLRRLEDANQCMVSVHKLYEGQTAVKGDSLLVDVTV